MHKKRSISIITIMWIFQTGTNEKRAWHRSGFLWWDVLKVDTRWCLTEYKDVIVFLYIASTRWNTVIHDMARHCLLYYVVVHFLKAGSNKCEWRRWWLTNRKLHHCNWVSAASWVDYHVHLSDVGPSLSFSYMETLFNKIVLEQFL